jgi:hypothetical protein
MTFDGPQRRESMDATNLAELYGLPLVDWDRIGARLREDHDGRGPVHGTPNLAPYVGDVPESS